MEYSCDVNLNYVCESNAPHYSLTVFSLEVLHTLVEKGLQSQVMQPGLKRTSRLKK
jgi:hypothetical protein